MMVSLQILIYFIFVRHVDRQSKNDILERRAIGYYSDSGLYQRRLKNLWMMTKIYMF